MAGMDDILTLIKNGRDEESPFAKPSDAASVTVFAEKKPLYSGEFHQAKANGIQLQHIMLLRNADYDGQRIAEYKGKRYSIYRTYPRNEDWIELYLTDMEHASL